MFDSLSTDELHFIKAIEKYKAKTGKTFLSWSEVFKIFTDLGYRKVPPRKQIPTPGAGETRTSDRRAPSVPGGPGGA